MKSYNIILYKLLFYDKNIYLLTILLYYIIDTIFYYNDTCRTLIIYNIKSYSFILFWYYENVVFIFLINYWLLIDLLWLLELWLMLLFTLLLLILELWLIFGLLNELLIWFWVDNVYYRWDNSLDELNYLLRLYLISEIVNWEDNDY